MDIRKFLQRTAAAGVVIALILFMCWPTLMAIGIRQNLHEYGLAIRSCNCSLKDKERVLDEIDELDERAEQIPTFFWIDENENIRSILKGGLTPDKLRLIERELQKMKRKLAPER